MGIRRYSHVHPVVQILGHISVNTADGPSAIGVVLSHPQPGAVALSRSGCIGRFIPVPGDVLHPGDLAAMGLDGNTLGVKPHIGIFTGYPAQ
ncbi:hypothetical protein D3C71_1883300 [compost metagenome]